MSDLKMTADVENIKNMSTFPNRDGGMSAEQVKARFDRAAVDIKLHINEVLAPAISDAKSVAYESVRFTEQTLKKEERERARANISAAKDTAVLYELQMLTEEQKDQARANIGAADASIVVTSVDGKTPERGAVHLNAVSYVEQQDLCSQDREMARKNIDAVSSATHTALQNVVQDLENNQHLTDDAVRGIEEELLALSSKAVCLNGNGAVDLRKNRMLIDLLSAGYVRSKVVAITDETAKNGYLVSFSDPEDGYAVADFSGADEDEPVRLRNIAPGRNETDAVNLAQVKEMVGGKKVYEHIATVTVTPDVDGNLPQYVTISADSNGNSFALTDFIIRANAGFVKGSNSTLYMDVNKNPVIANGVIGSIGTTCRYFNIFFRQEADGCVRAEYTSSAPADVYYNSQATIDQSRLIPPMYPQCKPPFTEIKLYTLLPSDGTKAWVEGSTFELWGVRV